MSSITTVLQHPGSVLRRVRNELKGGLEELAEVLSPKPSLSQIINQKEIRVVGLRRTGNHAIINWIRKQQTGSLEHLNNIPCGKNPYLHFYECHLKYDKYPKTQRKLKRRSQGKLELKDCLIYSYEDWDLEQITNSDFEAKHDLYLGKSGKRFDLIILRDPFNLLASRLKSNFMEVNAPGKTIVQLWIAYAKEYLGETQYLKHHRVCVNYNQWTADKVYRQQIASALELNFSDAGFNEVKSYGGGSSFEGLAFNGQAAKMDLHNRWKNFIDHPEYRRLLDNDELLDYSEKIFGYMSGTELLRSMVNL
jgi:hypothetical protein